MNSALGQTTGGITEVQQPDFMKQLLPQSIYLLERSLDRYGYFKKAGAPGMLVKAERHLIRRQLQFLFNLRAELTDHNTLPGRKPSSRDDLGENRGGPCF